VNGGSDEGKGWKGGDVLYEFCLLTQVRYLGVLKIYLI
jgi:hypothetical protein